MHVGLRDPEQPGESGVGFFLLYIISIFMSASVCEIYDSIRLIMQSSSLGSSSATIKCNDKSALDMNKNWRKQNFFLLFLKEILVTKLNTHFCLLPNSHTQWTFDFGSLN